MKAYSNVRTTIVNTTWFQRSLAGLAALLLIATGMSLMRMPSAATQAPRPHKPSAPGSGVIAGYVIGTNSVYDGGWWRTRDTQGRRVP